MQTMKNTEILCAVCNGESHPLSYMPDEAFSSGLLGVGYAIEPDDGHFYSPVEGRVISVSDTGHAYTILSDSGVDILVHIGVDTVQLGGRGFAPQVQNGQRVHAGDLICRADLNAIREADLPTATAVLVTEPDQIVSLDYRYGSVRAKESGIMQFQRRDET